MENLNLGATPDRGGRPEIGGTISTSIGTDLLRQVDHWATAAGISRAAAIRRLLANGLAADAATTQDDDAWTIADQIGDSLQNMEGVTNTQYADPTTGAEPHAHVWYGDTRYRVSVTKD